MTRITRRRTAILSVTALLLAAIGGRANADAQATYVIGLPTISGEVATYPISLEYSADTGEDIVFFSLDVSGSSDELTSSGTDFSRFSFTPALPLLADWNVLPGTGFGVGSNASSVEYDTFTAQLPPGTYPLGTLQTDFAGLAILPGAPGHVTLAADDSVVGLEVVDQIGTFRFMDAQVRIEQIPEPAASAMGVVAVLVLTRWRRNAPRELARAERVVLS
jgi:hypothetical protein